MPLSDPTFTSYTPSQAQTYAQLRPSYSSALYETLLTHHTSTGGHLDVVADVGCGPGNATRDLAASFDHAIGLDPSIEMINSARQLSANTRTGRDVVYAVSPAEECASAIPYPGVDLLTAAMAAHWFSMPEFWADAAKAVKPGGTVALWTKASLYCHPSTPNAAAVQRALFRLEREVLAPYELPPNRLSRDMYDNLILPWQTGDSALSAAFPESDFVRREWDRDGILSDGKEFFGKSTADDPDAGKTMLSSLEKGLDTASMVTRWREAHPELVGTERDCVRETMEEVRRVMGVAKEEDVAIKVGGGTVLLLFKRR
ncbi:S-adenosyl-L-methionine-dependent methyltransferase [Talaromyces proteolyticus]|uniref:S-adenosyl-L-methionine-dependent methyltransferase n=1 Tax=Talaromyces proteolyticus TaxID=1131652 RepID=A0AAD4L045_9EURO|nr:S-adenosyl-L-methionine-dependent methyltransferase [Talaromyces proteolyticus]KAH8701651.1 S-adenosyl-L-methionine-dependent methyltransferase [Talaromyces proteolyticus]